MHWWLPGVQARRNAGAINCMSENAPNIDTEDRIERAEWEAGSPPSEAGVDAKAAASGREPLQIEPLQNHVDTDALNALVTPQSDDSDTV